MDDPYGRKKKHDPASWDEEDFDRPWNKDSIDKIVRGHYQPYKKYEHASYLNDAGKPGFVNPEEFPERSEKLHKDVRDLIKRRAFNTESQSELQQKFTDAYELKYNDLLKGKREETKINLVAASLFNCCLNEERRETTGLIVDPSFLLWLFKRNVVCRRGIASKFLDLIEWKTQGTWDYGVDETRRLNEMGVRLCSWSALLSRRLAAMSAALKKYRPDEKKEEVGMEERELRTCIEREDTNEEKEKEGEREETTLSSVSRDYALIRLLDNEQFDRDHDLGEMMERMAEIDSAKNQLRLLLDWALRHRSAMGCTLAARIIAKWSLPSSRYDLLLFIVNARPTESEGRKRSGVGKGGGVKEGGKGETGEQRLLRALTRLFVALSYEALLTYQDLQELYTSSKEDVDGSANRGYSLPDLLAGLPLIGLTEQDKEGTRKAEVREYWKRIVALLNGGMCCGSAQSWHDPMSAEQEKAAKEVVERVRCLSHRDAHDLATRAGNVVLTKWFEAKGEESRISLPSRCALLLVCQLMDATVDSSLLPRFLLQQCLPDLLGVARRTPQLAVYASTAALFLTARCFQSHLTLHAMGAWRTLSGRMAELVHTLCPEHWQTRRLVELFGLEMPQGRCFMQHACNVSEPRDPVGVDKDATSYVQTLLERTKTWDERRLTTVADLVGDICVQVCTQAPRGWWRKRLVDEITSGPEKARAPMLRLLALSVYRGVIDAKEAVESAREGLRVEDPSIVSASLAILDTLLVGTSNRLEEELLVEGAIGGEEVAAVIVECSRMMGTPSPTRIDCSLIQIGLMNRQFGKRVMREEMEEIARREDSGDRAELYRQMARKCSANGWIGLEVDEGGRGLAAVTIFEADAARRELRWILVRGHNEKTSPTRDRLAASMWEAMRGEPSSSGCLQYVLLCELRAEMIDEEEAPPHCAPAYRAFAASMISGFIGLMKEPTRLPSSSSLLLPIVLFVWRDADEESRGRLRTEIRGFLSGWREGETTQLLLIARLAVSLSAGLRGKEGREWITPFHGLIRQGVFGPERNGELFAQVLEMMKWIESEDGIVEKEKERKGGEKKEKRKIEEESMNFDDWSTEEILRFLKPVQEFVKVQWYEVVEPRERKRGGLRISACRKFASDDRLNVRTKALEGWRRMYQAHSFSPRGRWSCSVGKRRKLTEDESAVQYGTAENPIEI